ncbi:DUF1775 domain-containing protein [Salipiger sp. IMCC34102]|uniref:DUF1775 domain-containing protein n=1 Tax=Salipiger sp. IMCC34102 TaxID=2510647 RepID=UPI00101B824D|nr:DUF1775 domain-containing protein [Salipiger sp. IMCC34102]RYH02733.1 DUF1775 domain-containing protein [Salipiger sp. IMCC34102]
MLIKTNLTALAAVLALTGAASAHATLEQDTAVVGASTKITLRVPHGCDGEATNTVRIEIPDGFYAVKPMPKAGWDLTTETGPYAEPFDNHGREMTECVRAVIWSNGDLADDHYDEFTLRGSVGPDMTAGEAMFFPAVQTCANGTADWTDTSGSNDVPNPAPKLDLVAGNAAQDHAHGHGHGSHGEAAAEVTTLGDLEIATPFARATLPNQPVAGSFMTITNTGAADDVLIAVSSPAAGRMEVHEMAMDGDVMRMRELDGGLPIPAGETVTLAPGGFHVMFMDLAGPLVEGDSVEVTLTFETSGDVSLTVPVTGIDDGAMDHSGHGGH